MIFQGQTPFFAQICESSARSSGSSSDSHYLNCDHICLNSSIKGYKMMKKIDYCFSFTTFKNLIWVLYLGSLLRYVIWIPYIGSFFGLLIWVSYLGSLFGFLIWVPYLGSLFWFLIWVSFLGSLFRFLIWVPQGSIRKVFVGFALSSDLCQSSWRLKGISVLFYPMNGVLYVT